MRLRNASPRAQQTAASLLWLFSQIGSSSTALAIATAVPITRACHGPRDENKNFSSAGFMGALAVANGSQPPERRPKGETP